MQGNGVKPIAPRSYPGHHVAFWAQRQVYPCIGETDVNSRRPSRDGLPLKRLLLEKYGARKTLLRIMVSPAGAGAARGAHEPDRSGRP